MGIGKKNKSFRGTTTRTRGGNRKVQPVEGPITEHQWGRQCRIPFWSIVKMLFGSMLGRKYQAVVFLSIHGSVVKQHGQQSTVRLRVPGHALVVRQAPKDEDS